MVSEYIQAALKRARYEKLEDSTWYAEIPGFQGVWANGPTVEECRADLIGALEGWILLGIQLHHPLPEIGVPLVVGSPPAQ